jgi:hypothetical protein
MATLVRRRQTKGPETDRRCLNHRATSRLYSTRSVRHSAATPALEKPSQTNHFQLTDGGKKFAKILHGLVMRRGPYRSCEARRTLDVAAGR